MTWTPPQQFEEYRIVRALGAGAMGQVFLAHDTLLDRAVAIKFVGALEVGAAARERFFTEARAIARLSHPNVIGIHRVGEVQRRPYLVSEYVRGTSLDALAKPVPWERAWKIALGLARGLASAHRRGVLHRDIKPANAVLGDDDEAKLLDFGLAKLVEEAARPAAAPVLPTGALDATTSLADRPERPAQPGGLTREDAIVGTPLYLAPELWRGGAASYRSDVYALGVVMYELLVGRAPHAGVPIAELPARVTERVSVTGEMPARLAELVERCIAVDPADRPEHADALCELLEAVVPKAIAVAEGSPYRGLATFESEHRALFFGRADETRAVVERLRTETFVVVAADSGAGKSSLCRASVLPAIAEKALAGRRWRVATMLPGTRPHAALEAALATASADDGILLFVDQLEEVLTIAEPAEAARFAERLAELVVATSTIRVLASARSDFLGRLAALPALGELVGRALFLLGPLADRGLREAIVGPARALGYEFESNDTVEELVASGRRHLPLLQFTLAELWDARDEKRRTIPAGALAQIGGVAGALGRRADLVLATLAERDREVAWRVFVRLMTAEGTRAVVARGDLAASIGDPDAVARVVDQLVAARLLVIVPGTDHVEVVHEALFTGWPRLVAWRRAHDEGTRMRDQQLEAARLWRERGRPRDLLWRGDTLDELRVWRRRWPERPTELETAFAAACEAEARRARVVRWSLVAVVALALLAGLVVLYRSDRRATAERDDAIAQRHTLLVEQGLQELAAGHAPRALPYLVEALRQDDTPALRFAIARALTDVERIRLSIRMPEGVACAAWSSDGTRFAAVSSHGVLHVFDREGRELVRGTSALQARASRCIYGPERIALLNDQAGIAVWDAATGRLVFERAHTELGVIASTDAREIAIAHDDRVDVHDLATGAVRVSIAGRTQGLALAPDHARIAIKHADGTSLYDASGTRISHAPPGPGPGLEFTPDGTRLISSGEESLVWDARTGEILGALATGPSAGYAISPDGRRLITGSADGVVHVWDLTTNKRIATLLGHTSGLAVAQFSSDGARIVTTSRDGTTRVWDAELGSLELTLDAAVTSPQTGTAMPVAASFSPDDQLLLVAAGTYVQLARAERVPLVGEVLNGAGTQPSATLSPDERTLAIAMHGGDLETWDLARAASVAKVHLGNTLWDVSWSPDGRELLVAGADRAEIRAARGDGVRALIGPGRAQTVNRAAYRPDGARVVTASTDRTARVWEAASARELLVLPHPDKVMSASWSRDGARIATADWGGSLRVWDAATGTQLATLHDDALKFLDVTFSPDGLRLAASSHAGLVTLWDIATRARTTALLGHTGPATTAVWSSDGALLATSSSDQTARIWDVSTGRELARFPLRSEGLQVTWNRDDTRIVVASSPVRVWDVHRETRSIAELDEVLRRKVPWKLVDGRLEVVDLDGPEAR